jgi:hypothetical protein
MEIQLYKFEIENCNCYDNLIYTKIANLTVSLYNENLQLGSLGLFRSSLIASICGLKWLVLFTPFFMQASAVVKIIIETCYWAHKIT